MHVAAPPGAVPALTQVLVVNMGNGIVATFQAGNDGSMNGDLIGRYAGRHFELWYDPATDAYGGGVDSRFRLATAQFIAAGSFGLFHATIENWLTPARAGVLNKVFDLSLPKNCVSDLATKPDGVENAVRLAAATHSYHFIRSTCATCDEAAWAGRWSTIVNKYNSGGKGYVIRNGLNDILKTAITVYGAR